MTDHYEENLAAIEEFLSSASAMTPCELRLGFELEHIIVDPGAQHAVPYEGEGDKPGVRVILEELRSYYTSESSSATTGALIGLSRKDEKGRETALTLEPGAQLEISTGPFHHVGEIEESYRTFRAELDPILTRYGYEAVTLGYQPYDNVRDIPLIPKKRYHFMDQYFATTGEHGISMMRGSASTQVSIDYCSEEDWANKLRAATVFGPVFSLLTDNTPIFDGVLDPSRMVRTRIWDDVDHDRCCVIPHLFDEGYGFKDYARYLLDAPIILCSRDGKDCFTDSTPARDIYKDHVLTKEDIAHLFSMFFFDVRTKNYIEIRVADSMPIEYALAYTALIRGLFYDEENLAFLTEFTARVQADAQASFVSHNGTDPSKSVDEAIAEAKQALIDDGYDAQVYGHSAHVILTDLIERAERGLDDTERAYLAPLASLVEKRTTLADIAKQEMQVVTA